MSRSRSLQRFAEKSIKRLMPAAAGCTNCRIKYSLLTREEGCSNCALSFCKKCVSYKAHLPKLADKPVSVCYECYQKLEAAKIKSTQSAEISVHPLRTTTKPPANWWGEGLPPPSMRQTIGAPPKAPPRLVAQRVMDRAKRMDSREPAGTVDHPTRILEQRFQELKRDENAVNPPPSVEEIEERLAALRGCDVELVRNPRLWFASSSREVPTGNTVAGLVEQATDQAALEEKYDPDRLLAERARRLQENDGIPEASSNDPSRMSAISTDTAYSEATKAEMDEINKLLADAEKRNAAVDADDKAVADELREVMKATRQKSLDIEKVNAEFTTFWDKQIKKTVGDSDSDTEPLDDETIRRIVAEAEATPDAPPAETKNQEESPKKKGLFNKIFKR